MREVLSFCGATRRSALRRKWRKIMNSKRIGYKTAALAIASVLTAGGCATQSGSFRRMTAEDHEAAAGALRTRTSDELGAATAQDHLAEAQRLRENEQSACFEIPDTERETGPFGRRDRIVGMEILRDRSFPKAPPQQAGVAIYLRAAPGMTEQWVGRLVECARAHRAAFGPRASSTVSALFESGPEFRVSATPTGFRVAIKSLDLDVSRAVIEKAHALVD
jgi:hypothetical protein